jgi:hypothetical protein
VTPSSGSDEENVILFAVSVFYPIATVISVSCPGIANDLPPWVRVMDFSFAARSVAEKVTESFSCVLDERFLL